MPDFVLPDSMALKPLRRPSVTDAEFRSAMSGLASSVHVVSARRGTERVGRTATSVMSLSAQPPALLISIDIISRLADIIARTEGFSVALLASDQSAVADAFAGSVPTEERFDVGTWDAWPSGQPLLVGAVSVFDCEVIGAMETGTHVLFAGAIVDVQTQAQRAPLIWHRRGYRELSAID
ncbi:MAG: flavin reductase [Devosia sp.]|uniref:flavin reductase family protein n=1 Tax=Devosia sp. TaxID=1871048 RepID=UPI0024CC4DBA|nr:flavin reductase family protein [Devosia sp.]UYN99773.1 MAG: flavin reductase [Devosia sp.]